MPSGAARSLHWSHPLVGIFLSVLGNKLLAMCWGDGSGDEVDDWLVGIKVSDIVKRDDDIVVALIGENVGVIRKVANFHEVEKAHAKIYA